jgi:folate-binding protein YgfZ
MVARMTSSALLNDRAVVSVSGPEAGAFLQGLITNDALNRQEGAAFYAALLTAQGKILFDFLVVIRGEAFLIDCRADLADALVKRLTLYRLRSKVVIERRNDLVVVVAWGDAAIAGAGYADPRLASLGYRAIVSRDAIPQNFAGGDAYLNHRLDCGVPEGADFGQDKIFALDADLDELHAVSFEKGCYVGQELTARMKHRGTARKRVLAVATREGGALPPPETPISAGAGDLGTILSSYHARGFALIRLDRFANAGTAELAAAGTSVEITKPTWLFA